jgi:uncharacterized protein YcnI
MRTQIRSLARTRLITCLAVCSAALVAWAAPAAAHVVFDGPDSGAAGSYVRTGFMVPHGCDGSPTTSLTVQIPEGITSVKPEAVPGWKASMTMRKLDKPVEAGHGQTIDEAPATVTWTGGPLPDSEFVSFGVSMKLPEGKPGDVLTFPVVQTCEQGEVRWIEVAAEGEEEPAHPAPQFTLTEAEDSHCAGNKDKHSAAKNGEAAQANIEAEPASATTSSGNGLAVAALVVGAAGLILGGAALATARRKAMPQAPLSS